MHTRSSPGTVMDECGNCFIWPVLCCFFKISSQYYPLVCVCACVRACMRACVRACVCVCDVYVMQHKVKVPNFFFGGFICWL